MKKLLILLFTLLISLNSYGVPEFDFSSDTFCVWSPKVQVRDGLFYLPNQQKPYSGENLCVYLSNGQYYSQGEIIKGLRDGKWTEWHENGQKEWEENFKDGDLVKRTQFLYYDNNQIKSEINFKDDKKGGKSTIWYKNGQIESERYYKDNQLNGKSTYWDKNGQKFIDANYKDDNPDGKWTFWKNNGQKDEERNYKEGDLVDKTIFKYGYFTGHLKSVKKYKDGKCISGDCPD